MKMLVRTMRRGVTFVELLLFLAILSIIVAVTVPMLFSATENRMLQQTISVVEQNGIQILQNVSRTVRGAERILSPAQSETGSVVALQMASAAADPVIVGSFSGSLLIIRHLTAETVSSSQVAVENFIVRNTSVSDTRQSLSVSFDISRTIRLQQPHSYSRHFETTVSLLPNDVPVGNACGCMAPSCASPDSYAWQVCQDTICRSATLQLECTP